jgi:8-oxo-dGTP diphosphatase
MVTSAIAAMPKDGLPRVGVGVMVWRDGKILLGERRGAHGETTWGWCGGHLEAGESLEACAVRETFEETGLVIEAADLAPLCVHNVLAYGRHYVDIEFWTGTAIGEPVVREVSKTRSWRWCGLDDLPTPLFEPVRLAISSWRDGLWFHRL